MVPLAKFDISLKNTPPGLAPFCTESWQRFPPIFFLISLAPTNIVVRVHTKKLRKNTETSAEESIRMLSGKSLLLSVSSSNSIACSTIASSV